MVAEPPALPGHDGARLDKDQGITPAGPSLGQPRPEEAIGDLGVGSGGAPLVDGELVPQREDLELEGSARSEAGPERREEGDEDRLHEGSKLPHLSGTEREPPAPAHAPRNSRDVGCFGVFGTHRRTMTKLAGAKAQG